MPRTIKKYANRRLYDTQSSRHVTLAGIQQLVARGEDVLVIDDTTGRDITRNILLQVVAEQEQGSRAILSAAMLRYLVNSYGSPWSARLSACLDRSVENFFSQQRSPDLAAVASDPVSNPMPHEGGPGAATTSLKD